ncbi:MAG TPA: RNA methyltransferase [Spirochaetota bacterium]|nr:RNA methyltransferase [Spirochaetota bacterium]
MTKSFAERIRDVISGSMRNGCSGVPKYLLNGNMACGVHKEALIVRVGPQHYEKELSKPFIEEFDITGRPMKGWVMVGCEGCEFQEELTRLVRLGVACAQSLPAK